MIPSVATDGGSSGGVLLKHSDTVLVALRAGARTVDWVLTDFFKGQLEQYLLDGAACRRARPEPSCRV